jgi:hypothetical protein
MPQGPKESRSPLSDIERFLQEVERLRRQAESQQSQRETPIDEVEVVRPPRQPARPRPPIVIEMPPRSHHVETELPEVLPVEPASLTQSAAKPHRIPPTAVELSRVTVAPAAPSPTVPTSATVPVPTGANLGQQLVQLLRSKQHIPLAIMLTEVFGPPRCRRPRY